MNSGQRNKPKTKKDLQETTDRVQFAHNGLHNSRLESLHAKRTSNQSHQRSSLNKFSFQR